MAELISLLQLIPPKAWIAIITALLTSGLMLIGVWLTNRANNQRLKIQFEYERKIKAENLLRDRLEELYITSNTFFTRLVTHYLPFRMVMNGEISFNDALDMVIEYGKSKEYDPNRVTMLINMYFPEIKPEFKQIMEIREELNKIIDSYKEEYKAGNIDGSKWLELFQPLFGELGILTDGFDKHIIKLKNWNTNTSKD